MYILLFIIIHFIYAQETHRHRRAMKKYILFNDRHMFEMLIEIDLFTTKKPSKYINKNYPNDYRAIPCQLRQFINPTLSYQAKNLHVHSNPQNIEVSKSSAPEVL